MNLESVIMKLIPLFLLPHVFSIGNNDPIIQVRLTKISLPPLQTQTYIGKIIFYFYNNILKNFYK